MRAVRATAFRAQLEARVNGVFELRSGSRQESWDDVCMFVCVRVMQLAVVVVGLNSNQVERTVGSAS